MAQVSNNVRFWVDIAAPREEVFYLLLNLERRMQLSPLWGTARILEKEAELLEDGSTYLVEVRHEETTVQYATTVTELVPMRKLCYRIDVPQQTFVIWTVQDAAPGTRLSYEEQYLIEEEQSEDINGQVSDIVQKWLKNIKNYAELRGTRTRRVIKWILDRYFLKLRNDQRNVILLVLFMQITGMISFIMAAIALGIAGLFT